MWVKPRHLLSVYYTVALIVSVLLGVNFCWSLIFFGEYSNQHLLLLGLSFSLFLLPNFLHRLYSTVSGNSSRH